MDIRGLRAIVTEVNFSTHGVDAIVTVPGDPPITTRVISPTPITQEVPVGGAVRRADARRLLVIKRADVADVLRGTLVEFADEIGGPVLTWTVDSFERDDPHHFRVLAVPA